MMVVVVVDPASSASVGQSQHHTRQRQMETERQMAAPRLVERLECQSPATFRQVRE